jgi:hypothetical protein
MTRAVKPIDFAGVNFKAMVNRTLQAFNDPASG